MDSGDILEESEMEALFRSNLFDIEHAIQFAVSNLSSSQDEVGKKSCSDGQEVVIPPADVSGDPQFRQVWNDIDRSQDNLKCTEQAIKPAVWGHASSDASPVGKKVGQEGVTAPLPVLGESLHGDIIDADVRQVLDDVIIRVREILNGEALEDIAKDIAELRVMETSRYWEEGHLAKSDIPFKRYLEVAALVRGIGGTDAV